MLFHHLREQDGLSNNFVTRFFRDSRGVLWLGTQNGLNRFDGSHFHTFTRSREPHSIADNVILDLCEDKQGRIWGATSNGIFCYTVETNQFRNYRTPSTRYARVIKNIYCDSKGRIWATGEWNIMRYDSTADTFTDIIPLTSHKDSLNDYAVVRNGLIEDPAGQGIWVATRRGLHLYMPERNQYLDYRNNNGDERLNDHAYSAFHVSWNGQIWVYDRSAMSILCFDKNMKRQLKKIPLPDSTGKLFVSCVFEDRSNRVWFSTWDNGIYMADPGRQFRITRFLHDVSDPFSIAGQFMWDMMQDRDGTIWCGTTGGVSLTNPEKSVYSIYRFADQFPELKHTEINVVTPDPDGQRWWLAFSGNRFGFYSTTTGALDLYSLNQLPPPANSWPINGIHHFRFYGDTVFATSRNGTLLYSKRTKQWSLFNPVGKRLDGFVIRDLVRMDDSTWYFNNYYSLARWNPHTGSLLEIKPPVDTMDNGQKPVFDKMRLDQQKRLWFIAGFSRVGSLTPDGQLKYYHIQDKSKLDYNGYYSALHLDQQGRLWLSNNGAGVDCFDPAGSVSTSFFQSDGLISDNMTSVITDRQGRVWATSNNRFSVFQPGSGKYYNFSIPLNEELYNYSTYSTQTTSGTLLVTLFDHLAEFYPDKIALRPENPLPEISVVQVNGKTVFINKQEVLSLEPGETNLRFQFGMQTDKQVFPYRFRYRLKGADSDWQIAGNGDEAAYSGLPSGTYTFYLRAESESGTWVSPEVQLKLVIRTPFLQTRFFYLLVLAGISILLFLLYRYRIRQQEQLLQLENKAQKLEKEKAQVMYENLKQHLNPHFLFNSLTSLGSLIRLQPSQAIVFLDKMSKVYRYVLRNRDNETVPLEEELKFVQLYNDLQRTRFESALQIFIRIPDELYHRRIPPVTLQNLVENAIKHNTADPDSPLVIEIYTEDDYLIVRNNLQRKNVVETSNKQGLQNMDSLFRFLSDRPMETIQTDQFFIVKIPLL